PLRGGLPTLGFAASTPPLFSALSVHDALPILLLPVRQQARFPFGFVRETDGFQHVVNSIPLRRRNSRKQRTPHRATAFQRQPDVDRKSTRLNSSHVKISYAVFCLKEKMSTRMK